MKIRSVLWLAILLLGTCTASLAQQSRTEKGNLVMEGIPDKIPARIAEKLNQYNNVRSAGIADWTPDGEGLIISTRFGDVTQLHRVAAPGGYREQLTFYTEPVGGAASNPDPNRQTFLFSKDEGGSENYQLYTFHLPTRKTAQITEGKFRNTGARWSQKGSQLCYLSNKRSGKDMDLYIASADAPANATMALQLEGGGWGVADWREDGTQMILRKGISANESQLYLFDIISGRLEQINPSQKQIAYANAKYTKNGRGAYILSDEDTDFRNLHYYDFGTRKFTSLTQAIKWDVSGMEMNDQGTLLAFSSNEDGYSRLYLLNTATNKYEQVHGLLNGVIGNYEFDPKGTRLAISMGTSTSPGDCYVYDTNSKSLTRWTYSEMGGLDPAKFTEPQLVHYPTFDKANKKDKTNRQIPAFVYKPANAKGKLPVLISIHGGPEAQSLPNFSTTAQYLVNELGMAVIVPNVRGSSGYGKEYLKLDNGFLRENSVKDIGALLDWIAKQPDLDASRVAVMGGSYGGYMTLASMTNYNNRLRAGIDIVGISNFVTFLKNTADYRRDLRRVEYGDEQDPKMEAHLQKISPNNNVQKINKPMFIIQGANDPRVPLSEAEQMVEALKKNGSPTWYLMAKDEGHGFAKKQNRDFMNAAVMLFIEQFVVGTDGGNTGSGK